MSRHPEPDARILPYPAVVVCPLEDIRSGVPGWYNHFTAVGGDWSRILVSGNNRFKGLSMDRVMSLRTQNKPHADLFDELFDFLIEEDGSIGAVHYLANGPKAYPKERVEIFSEGRVLVIDNWRQLRAYGWGGVPRMKMRQDKGHQAEVAGFLDRVANGGAPLIPFGDLDMVTMASFAAVRSAQERVTIGTDVRG